MQNILKKTFCFKLFIFIVLISSIYFINNYLEFKYKIFASNPSITLSPSSAIPGTNIALTGSNFSPNLKLEIIGIDNDLNKNNSCISDGGGSFSCIFQIPSDIPSTLYGNQTIFIEPAPGGKILATANLNIVAPPLTPSIKLSPSSGTLGDNITVIGTSFSANAGVVIRGLDRDLNRSCSADSKGNFSCIFQIPKDLQISKYLGSQTISVYSGSGGLGPTAFTTLIINKPSIAITLNPNTGDGSQDILISGNNFPANNNSILVGGFNSPRELSTCSTDSAGNLTNCGISSSTIKSLSQNLSTGSYTINLLYDGETVASAEFNYIAPTPSGTVIASCSNEYYYSKHVSECKCVYDNSAGQYNQNTYTALGCLPSNLGGVVNIILTIAIGLASVVTLIRIIFGGYEIMTNPAGPDEIKEGQQMITNAVLGLMFIILAVVILRIIGINILQIPGIDAIFGK